MSIEFVLTVDIHLLLKKRYEMYVYKYHFTKGKAFSTINVCTHHSKLSLHSIVPMSRSLQL